ncbi:hypothetical protein [Cupriavidus sp. AcVe19-6a]|uniref:hypothetical protein n=1 Tax=Cupriavidus sp. AcVe19-6a TaxID=2821358 RepID=UPI001AE3CDF6|nr:hypothetical protein [Cupriavidus sp. AcVe19-6a]MBP0640125.1 hypothetical protein [Cupriavidus sp. AcVe19-6a]
MAASVSRQAHEALLYLDAQREKVLPMHEHLKLMIDQLIKSGENAAAYFSSPEYAQQSELLWLQGSPLATFLCDVAMNRPGFRGGTFA